MRRHQFLAGVVAAAWLVAACGGQDVALSQAKQSLTDTTPPVLLSASVSGAISQSVFLHYNEALSGSVIPQNLTSFYVTINGNGFTPEVVSYSNSTDVNLASSS